MSRDLSWLGARGMVASGAFLWAAACGGRGDKTLPQAMQISPDGIRVMSPSYSPDGKRMAWFTPAPDSSGGGQLQVANADMRGQPTLLVTSSFFGIPAVWSPDGTRIATSSSDSGRVDVVVVPAAGGPLQRVARREGFAAPTVWYPDGDRLAYNASAEGGTYTTFVVSSKTGISRRLVEGEKRPLFGFPSPDASQIAYNVFDGGKHTIWIANGDGASPRQLSTEGFEDLGTAPWSPDGKQLLYESRRTGTADLWVLPLDGGKPRQLTRDVRNDFAGRWSADGKWIAFVSDRGRQTDIWIVPAAGGAERRVTETALVENRDLTWRPGTQQLTFSTSIQRSGVWAVDIATGAERRLTPDSLQVNLPVVSPDGKQVLFQIERGGGILDLAVIPLEGGPWRPLWSGGGNAWRFSWSPDGSKVVLMSDRGGSYDIWVVDLAGGPPRQLTNWPGGEDNPAWSGDGSTVYFLSDRDARIGDVWKVSPSGGEPVRVTREGNIDAIVRTRAGVSDVFVTTVSARGQFAFSRLLKDGRLQTVWDKTSFDGSWPLPSPTGDSLVFTMVRPDGKLATMMVSAGGGDGRRILGANNPVFDWSKDGKWMAYTMGVANEPELGLYNVADGTTRRLTTTPEGEFDPTFTPDAKTVVFRRRVRKQAIWTVDLSKLLAAKP